MPYYCNQGFFSLFFNALLLNHGLVWFQEPSFFTFLNALLLTIRLFMTNINAQLLKVGFNKFFYIMKCPTIHIRPIFAIYQCPTIKI